ncbi:glycosyltransferase family 2 protein [Actinocorallia sp. B10E7]|uniref:glycosyltransferase family 2 protein n=1 Tax=Actinocorallia sp. B10E7 TaxID=3153558 RepID=UPI00325C95AF
MALNLDRHVVTAVLVAHDGARWLPETLKALLTQTRRIQRLVVVDTGSTDKGPAVIGGVVGPGNLLTLGRDVPFAAAVARALEQPAANIPVDTDGTAAPVEWIWILHDDCAPAPRALERLLAEADADPHIGLIGPKLRDWEDRRLLLEVGITLDGQGRRETGVDRDEFDQGQHDGVPDVLAVSTAGMLVRRDVWAQTGGLDPEFGLFRDDVDFGWRVHAAGHRVVATSDAVVFHAEASARGLREQPVSHRRLDRRNAMYVLLANQPLRPALVTFARLMFGSLVRVIGLLVAKKPMAMRDELDAVRDVVGSPGRLRALRAARAQGRARVYRAVRRFQPHLVTLRRLADKAASLIAPTEYGLDLSEEEEPPPDRGLGLGTVRRILAHPSAVVLLVLSAVAFLAERSLLAAGGRLGGGALVPITQSAGELWESYTSGWHPSGLGSADASPPWTAVLSGLSALTFGHPSLVVTGLLLGCVPLSGLTAYLAAKRLVPAGLPVGRRAARLIGRRRIPASAIRAWAAIAYALLPVAGGAIASGRFGTCVVYVLLPLIGLAGARVLRLPEGRVDARHARRAAWALALLLTVAMAFVPLTWLMVAVLGCLALWWPGTARPGDVAIALAVPPLLLLPTTIGLVLHPSRFLLEAGLHRPELVDRNLSASSILTLDPGGPGTDLGWATAGLLALAVAALPLRSRRTAVLGGWALILLGFLTAVVVSAVTVEEAAGEGAPAWPGVPLAIAAGGLVLTAGAALQRAVELWSGRDWIYRVGGVCSVLVAVSTPVLAGVAWIGSGVRGPIGEVEGGPLPAFVSAAADGTRARTLVLGLRQDGGVGYTLLRGASPRAGEEEPQPSDAARERLDVLVAQLAAGQGADGLARMGVHHLVVRGPERQEPLLAVLDAVPQLVRLSRGADFAVWRLSEPGGRLMLVDGAEITPLESGEVAAKARIPAGEEGRELLLAEPAGGWNARFDGVAAEAGTADGWAASWKVPAGGGTFTLEREDPLWPKWIVVQGVAFLLVVVLALPGGELPVKRGDRPWRGPGRRRAAEPRPETPSGTTEPAELPA